jgi:LPS export ABC transporter protein LptC
LNIISKVKIALYCFIGLAVAGIGLGLVSHLRVKEEPKGLNPVPQKDSDVSLNRIHHVATREGIKEWTLDAESAQYEKADNKTVFKDLVVTFFLEDGNTMSLSSRGGALLTDTKDMEVWGDVVARSGQYELNTEKLSYEHETRTIFSKTPVVIKGSGMKITGKSMKFDLEAEQVMMRGRVEAVFENFSL